MALFIYKVGLKTQKQIYESKLTNLQRLLLSKSISNFLSFIFALVMVFIIQELSATWLDELVQWFPNFLKNLRNGPLVICLEQVQNFPQDNNKCKIFPS